MNRLMRGGIILVSGFVFYLLTGNADLAFFGMIGAGYFEYRVLGGKD